jgi:hypothetical protein
MGILRRRLMRLIEMPRDLDEVIVIDRNKEVDPREVGLRPADLDRAWDHVIKVYRSGVHPAITINLRRRGKVVMARSIGHARGNGPDDGPGQRPRARRAGYADVPVLGLQGDHRPAGAHACRGRPGRPGGPGDPLRPGVRAQGQGRHHPPPGPRAPRRHSGPPRGTPLEVLWDEDQTWELLCDAEPIITDGSKLAYHAITGGFVLERVLRVVTGAGIDAYLERRIRKPMGMKYFTYGARPEHRDALALNYATGPHQGPVLGTLIRRALGTDMKAIASISNDVALPRGDHPGGQPRGLGRRKPRRSSR